MLTWRLYIRILKRWIMVGQQEKKKTGSGMRVAEKSKIRILDSYGMELTDPNNLTFDHVSVSLPCEVL